MTRLLSGSAGGDSGLRAPVRFATTSVIAASCASSGLATPSLSTRIVPVVSGAGSAGRGSGAGSAGRSGVRGAGAGTWARGPMIAAISAPMPASIPISLPPNAGCAIFSYSGPRIAPSAPRCAAPVAAFSAAPLPARASKPPAFDNGSAPIAVFAARFEALAFATVAPSTPASSKSSARVTVDGSANEGCAATAPLARFWMKAGSAASFGPTVAAPPAIMLGAIAPRLPTTFATVAPAPICSAFGSIA